MLSKPHFPRSNVGGLQLPHHHFPDPMWGESNSPHHHFLDSMWGESNCPHHHFLDSMWGESNFPQGFPPAHHRFLVGNSTPAFQLAWHTLRHAFSVVLENIKRCHIHKVTFGTIVVVPSLLVVSPSLSDCPIELPPPCGGDAPHGFHAVTYMFSIVDRIPDV